MAGSRDFIGGVVLALALALAGAARAAEPVRPAPEAARSCPKSGAGFVRIPGSDTCIRLSGRVTAGVDAGPARGTVATTPPNAARLAIDTRTDTEYGPVRAFVRMGGGHR